jgi:hypothetical protein
MRTALASPRTGPVQPQDALEPVREALLARARADAAALLDEADRDATAELAAARRRVERLREDAVVQGRADAKVAVRSHLARARGEARARVLHARRAAYEELRVRVQESAARLVHDPAYPAFRDRLVTRAKEELGPDAVVTEDATGGVTAVAGARRVSYTLVALADMVLAELGEEVDGLWQP